MRLVPAVLLVLLQLAALVLGGRAFEVCTDMGMSGLASFGSCCTAADESPAAPVATADESNCCAADECCAEIRPQAPDPARPESSERAGALLAWVAMPDAPCVRALPAPRDIERFQASRPSRSLARARALPLRI